MEVIYRREKTFRNGEQNILTQYEVGKLPNRETTQVEQLRSDDIF